MRYLVAVFFVCCFSSLYAQTGVVTGKIADSSGKKFLALTTITVFTAKDTNIITYRLSTDGGDFRIPGLPMDVPLRIMATYSGYEAFRQDFVVTAATPAINFGTIRLTNTSKQLDEVIVVSERPPVVIKRDTIEFNASAFKTLPNALLEDLLKKLPGVTVDENGNIMVNGQKVNRLLVDGKRFFGDEPQMATRNLPSNLIDKVQVVDDKDEIALNNDGDMSRIGKVINITLKKSVKKAVFGRVFAGGGTNDRYEAGGIVNTFRDTFQVSLIGFSNNINRSSFSFKDVTQLGGFSRSGWGNINGSSNASGQQGFTLDGFSLGGTGAGLNRATGAGININHSPNTHINFSLQYMYGVTHNDLVQTQNTARFFNDTVVNTNVQQTATSNGRTHNAGIGGGWKPDSLTNTTFRFTYAFSGTNTELPSTLVTDNNKIGVLSTGNGILYTDSKTNSYNHYLTFTHRFLNRKGRNLSVSNYMNYNANPLSSITESLNNYLYPVTSDIIFQQLRATNAPATSNSTYINYSDPISSKLTLRINQSINYNKNVQDVLTYGKSISSGQYDSLNVSLSNGLAREQTRWSNNIVLGYRVKEVNINIGGNWLQQWINNSFTASPQNSRLYYSNLLLTFNMNWKKISLGFSQDINPPGINYMMPVPDNSNPFYITYGNPDLKPVRRNTVSFNGSIFKTKTNTNVYFSGNSTVTDDAVIYSVVLNSEGIQTNRPLNVSGVWSNYFNAGFNRQFKNKQKLSLTVDVGPTFNFTRTPLLFNNVQSRLTNINAGITSGLSFNYQDLVEFTPKYTINNNRSYYTSPSFNGTNIIAQVLQGEFILRIPKKIVWETNLFYRHLNSVSPGLPNTSVYWNAAVTILMFKQDKGQLRFAVYDILNSNTNVNRYYSTNAIIDTRSNVLQRYFMVTYTYNIRTFGNQPTKVGGKSNLFNF